MRQNLLKIDTDTRTALETINLLKDRLSYMHDMGVFYAQGVDRIVLGFKTRWNAKIYLKKNIEPAQIIMFQLILGSDWRKECNTILNHYILNMEYSNRMFDIKRYNNGKVIVAKTKEVTTEIKEYILNKNRHVNEN